ncbi:MAG TPA: energy transducer TonB [Pyrinomonadaceae bacterium]|nr:energy transducer TonB [Pyrinomonadaceae bacterium]
MKCYRDEYHPTILSSSGLSRRLAAELRFTAEQLRKTWPDFRRDPIAFGRILLSDSGNLLRERFGVQTFASSLTALTVVLTAVFVVMTFERIDPKNRLTNETDSSLVEILTLPVSSHEATVPNSGVGIGTGGRVGFRQGRGEGSEHRFKRARGGGSSGDRDVSDAQQGKIPQSSEIPAPIPQLPPARKQVLPVAGIDIDPALWKDLKFPVYGDPRSKSTPPSNGPGDKGGMGTNNGAGIGEGTGDGFGPGSDGNTGGNSREIGGLGPGGGTGNNPDDPEQIFRISKVDQRARVLAKPEPQYTEEARRHQITGTVVLHAVFSKGGNVINIRAVHSLPFGLTEKAIAAARQIRFLPAMKASRPVSVYMQLEYNFNLY